MVIKCALIIQNKNKIKYESTCLYKPILKDDKNKQNKIIFETFKKKPLSQYKVNKRVSNNGCNNACALNILDFPYLFIFSMSRLSYQGFGIYFIHKTCHKLLIFFSI